MENKKGRFTVGHTSWLKGTKGLAKANSGSFKKGQVSSTKGKRKSTPAWNKGKRYKITKESLSKGKHYSPKTEFQKAEWKFHGTLNEYRNLHKKIHRSFGSPNICEDCGKSGLTGKQIHWANKSKTYLLDRSDWIRLCVKCHFIFDGRRNLL